MKSRAWSNRSASVGIVLSWLAAVVVSLPQLFLFKVQSLRAREHEIETCSVKWPSKLAEASYILFHLATQFFIPLTVLIFFYSKIFIIVSRSIRYKKESLRAERSHTIQQVESSLVGAAAADIIKRDSGNSSSSTGDNRNENDGEDNGGGEERLSLNDAQTKIVKKKKRKSFFNRRNTPPSPAAAAPHQNLAQMNFMSNNNSSRATEGQYLSNDSDNQYNMTALKIASTAKKNLVPMRQNLTRAELTKSKMKTLKLTMTVVLTYVFCSLPFYIAVTFNFIVDVSAQDYSNPFKKGMCK
jgi:hypothetical protein